MGLFDIFTGNSVKDAAEANKGLYQKNKQEGLGYLDTGYNRASDALNNGVSAYAPLTGLGASFGNGANMYLNALGVNGPDGTAAARSAFAASPSYTFQLGQGLQAIDRGAASRGLVSSGNTLMAEQKYGSDLANTEYGNWLNSLGATMYPAISATQGGATGQAQGYGNLANLAQNDAQNRVNLNTTTTSGLANSNMQAANAEMQGSGNLFNFGLNTAKLISGWGK